MYACTMPKKKLHATAFAVFSSRHFDFLISSFSLEIRSSHFIFSKFLSPYPADSLTYYYYYFFFETYTVRVAIILPVISRIGANELFLFHTGIL